MARKEFRCEVRMQYNLWDSCPKPALDSRWIDDPFMISCLPNHSELDYLVPTLTLESFPQSARARLAALVSWNKSGQRGVRLKFIRAGIRRRLQVPINPRRAYCIHPKQVTCDQHKITKWVITVSVFEAYLLVLEDWHLYHNPAALQQGTWCEGNPTFFKSFAWKCALHPSAATGKVGEGHSVAPPVHKAKECVTSLDVQLAVPSNDWDS